MTGMRIHEDRAVKPGLQRVNAIRPHAGCKCCASGSASCRGQTHSGTGIALCLRRFPEQTFRGAGVPGRAPFCTAFSNELAFLNILTVFSQFALEKNTLLEYHIWVCKSPQNVIRRTGAYAYAPPGCGHFSRCCAKRPLCLEPGAETGGRGRRFQARFPRAGTDGSALNPC